MASTLGVICSQEVVRKESKMNPVRLEMFYVYVLLSEKDKNFYTGCTSNLKKRMEEHNNDLVMSTKNRKPLKLIYYEACLDKRDAFLREKYLKDNHW